MRKETRCLRAGFKAFRRHCKRNGYDLNEAGRQLRKIMYDCYHEPLRRWMKEMRLGFHVTESIGRLQRYKPRQYGLTP